MSHFPRDGVIISDCIINSRGVGMSLEPNEVDHFPPDTGQTMLYERYGQAIFGYLRLHAHSLEDAEDLLLEVFLAALERDNLSALPPGGQLAWLRRVAHNKLLNLYRQASRHPRVALALWETPCSKQMARSSRRWLAFMNASRTVHSHSRRLTPCGSMTLRALGSASLLLGRLRRSPSSGGGGSRASVPTRQPCLS
jgi:Sigma-70 region 2